MGNTTSSSNFSSGKQLGDIGHNKIPVDKEDHLIGIIPIQELGFNSNATILPIDKENKEYLIFTPKSEIIRGTLGSNLMFALEKVAEFVKKN